MTQLTSFRGFIFFLLVFFAFLALFFVFTQNPAMSAMLAGLTGAAGTTLKSRMSALEADLDQKRGETVELQQKTDSLAEEASQLRRRLAGPRFELPPKVTERYVRVAIAGLGGTGKTSLIRKLSGCRLADPRKKTGRASTYSIVRETAYVDHTEVTRYDLEDYRGQNASDLLESMRTNEEAFPVTALLLMVDLFELVDEETGTHSVASPGKLWDQSRVEKHLREWSDQLIGVLMDSLPNAQYIGLFVNKSDLIEAPLQRHETELRQLFSPLLTSIRARSAERLVRVYLGSAQTDRMLSTLLLDWSEEAFVENIGHRRGHL